MKTENEMQVTALQRFFEENSNVCIRAQVINDEPWFVAKDVCQALLIKNSRDAVSNLDDDEISDVVLTDTRSKGGGTQRRTLKIVNESGLYGLIMLSRKPEAKPFRKWVTKEVLPTLRKTGVYALQGSLNRNGVEGILYNGMKLYPYKEMLLSYGYSGRSGSVQRRKKVYPYYFVKVYGRVYIKEEMAVYLEEEKKHIDRRLEMMKKQQVLPFSVEG